MTFFIYDYHSASGIWEHLVVTKYPKKLLSRKLIHRRKITPGPMSISSPGYMAKPRLLDKESLSQEQRVAIYRYALDYTFDYV